MIVCCVCVWLNQCCLACRPVAADPKASRALLNPSELRFLRYVSHSLLSLYPLLYALPRTTLLICARWWCSAEGLCYCILAKLPLHCFTVYNYVYCTKNPFTIYKMAKILFNRQKLESKPTCYITNQF